MINFLKEYFLRSSKQFIKNHSGSMLMLVILIITTIFVVGNIVLLQVPSASFPDGSVITIQNGHNLSEIAQQLEDKNVVKSSFWLRNFVIVLGGERGVIAGDYYFDEPASIYAVAKRITYGNHGFEPIKITIPEGLNVLEISERFKSQFPLFDTQEFIALAHDLEGFLFPDTYFFLPSVQPEEVVDRMQTRFYEKISEVQNEIDSFGTPFEEVIVMASILEGEARDTESRKMVAGILWSRLEIDMPLQVDTTFKYINGKNSYNLSLDDLDLDSPYNTYKYKGLPPTPISNPGLDSILSAITPIKSDFIYFLTDLSGQMHYAVTFDDHIKNKRLYMMNE